MHPAALPAAAPRSNAVTRAPSGRRPFAGLALGAALVAVIVGCTSAAGPAATQVAGASPGASAAASAATPGSFSPAPSASAGPSAAPTASSGGDSDGIDPRVDGLDVVFGEFAITLETNVIRPGPVTFVVHNAGHLTHGFEMRIESSGGGGGDRDKIETRRFQSGETLRVEADLEPGVYEIECYVADHEERGMKAYLAVRADAPLMTPAASGTTPGIARIVQFAFVPTALEVPAGTEVSWVNEDPAPHTITATDGAFDSRQLDPGGRFTVTLDAPGDYLYRCEIHPTMVGEVRVR